MVYLTAAIIALLAGPALFEWGRAGARIRAFLDGFAFITIAGLFLFGVLPEAVETVGPIAWLFAAAGIGFPIVAEKFFHHAANRAHLGVLLLAGLGLAAHSVFDGLALHGGDLHSGPGGLAMAIVAHNLSKGIALWFLLAPNFGRGVSTALFLLLMAATVFGYLASDTVLTALSRPEIAAFQAFVAGSILHVVLHGPVHGPGHGHGHGPVHGPSHASAGPDGSGLHWPERVGLLVGLVLLYAFVLGM